MAASAAFSVEGSTPTGAVAVAASSTVDLALLSTSGVNTVAWSIVGNHSSAASNPTITPAGSPSGATASFVMPAGAGQAYLVQCVVNGGVDANGDADAALTKRHIVGVNNGASRVPFCVGEELERQATHGWTEVMNDLSASATTGAVTPPTNPGQDGYLARASGGDLTYFGGSATGQVVKWNGTAWVAGAADLTDLDAVTGILGVANGGTGLAVLGAANTVLKVNAGGVANEYGKLTTANLDAAAGILGSQLAATVAVTNLTATGYIALGADPADAGAIRLSHAMGVYGESNTPGTDRAVLTWGVSAVDTVTLGDAAVPTEIVGSSVGINAAAGTMIEAVEVAAGRRVVSLAFGADLSTTEMPANTGDRVLFIANCATAPTTGDPTSGLIAYGTSGALGLHAAGVTFHERVTLSGITHAARSTDAAATAMVFTPQAPYASATGANRDAVGFTVALSAPAGASIVEAGFDVKRGSNLVCRLGPSPSSPTTLGAMWLGGALTASATNYCVASTSTYTIINAPGGSDTVYLRAGHSTNLFAANTTEITPYIAAIAWPSTVTAPTLKQATHATTPQTMTLQAMNVTTGIGSNLVLTSGTGSASDGAVQLQVGTESMIEAVEVAAGRRVVALCRGSGVTTTQLPANTGDRVVYLADCAMAPTGTPVGGGIISSQSGDIYWTDDAGVTSQLN